MQGTIEGVNSLNRLLIDNKTVNLEEELLIILFYRLLKLWDECLVGLILVLVKNCTKMALIERNGIMSNHSICSK